MNSNNYCPVCNTGRLPPWQTGKKGAPWSGTPSFLLTAVIVVVTAVIVAVNAVYAVIVVVSAVIVAVNAVMIVVVAVNAVIAKAVIVAANVAEPLPVVGQFF